MIGPAGFMQGPKPPEKKIKTLRDWLPPDIIVESFPNLIKHLDVRVHTEYGQYFNEELGVIQYRTAWDSPFKHKNVHNWCILENGYAVGWNENPSTGWSFPVRNMNRYNEKWKY